jgi:dCTP deaminase
MSESIVQAESKSGIELLHFLQPQVRDESAAIRDAIDLRIVEQHRHPVAREMDIGFEDSGTRGETPLEGVQCVLGRTARAAAVTDDDRSGEGEVGVPHSAYGIMARSMSVLTRDAIFAEIDAGRLKLTPFSRDQVGVASIDLTLGDEIRVIETGDGPIDVENGADFRDHTQVQSLARPYDLDPGSTIHGITLERIELPPNLCGFLEGRSRFARLGLMIHVTSAFVQPGVSNRQVLEMSNVSARTLRIHAGVRLCQIVLMRTEGESRYQGRFSDQDEI